MSERDPNVYAIASGEYSDYSIHCVFERREDAVAYLESIGGVPKIDRHYSDQEYWAVAVLREYAGGSIPEEDRYRIEPFQFWPVGNVPHADGGKALKEVSA